MSRPAQQALDIVTNLSTAIGTGAADPSSKNVTLQTLAAVQLLAEDVLGGTPTSVSVDAGAETATDVSVNTAVATES